MYILPHFFKRTTNLDNGRGAVVVAESGTHALKICLAQTVLETREQ